MGLAQKKVKQRIPANPRNVSWSKQGVGRNMLEKLGWKEGEGLGARGEGSIVPVIPVIKSEEVAMEGIGMEDAKRERANEWEMKLQSYDEMLRKMKESCGGKVLKRKDQCKTVMHMPHRRKFIQAKEEANRNSGILVRREK